MLLITVVVVGIALLVAGLVWLWRVRRAPLARRRMVWPVALAAFGLGLAVSTALSGMLLA